MSSIVRLFPLGDDSPSVERPGLAACCSASHRLTSSAGMRNSFSPILKCFSLPFLMSLWTCCTVHPHRSASCLGAEGAFSHHCS
jgi:hypothetical protein